MHVIDSLLPTGNFGIFFKILTKEKKTTSKRNRRHNLKIGRMLQWATIREMLSNLLNNETEMHFMMSFQSLSKQLNIMFIDFKINSAWPISLRHNTSQFKLSYSSSTKLFNINFYRLILKEEQVLRGKKTTNSNLSSLFGDSLWNW